MKVDNGHLFPRLKPMIARDKSVMLVGLAVTITPEVKLAAEANPGHTSFLRWSFVPELQFSSDTHQKFGNGSQQGTFSGTGGTSNQHGFAAGRCERDPAQQWGAIRQIEIQVIDANREVAMSNNDLL